MPRTLSQDLRDKVVPAIDGGISAERLPSLAAVSGNSGPNKIAGYSPRRQKIVATPLSNPDTYLNDYGAELPFRTDITYVLRRTVERGKCP